VQYSAKERLIARLLSKFPKLKRFAKIVYQKVNYIRHKKDYKYKSDYKITKIAYNGQESFFGYYDKSPISKDNRYIIFQSVLDDTKNLPNANTPVELVLYDTQHDAYEVVDKVSSYNWQQGSKLMWIENKSFIYNNFDSQKNEYISKIYDVETQELKSINYPVYDCFKDIYALSVNFDRLQALRPDYGYRNKENIDVDWEDNTSDGIYYIDLQSNQKRLLLTIESVIDLHKKETMLGAKHKLNHLMISPDGSKFMFLHRWFVGERKFDSLIISDSDGTNLKCLSDDDMVSHCFWYGDDKIFGYLRDKEMGDKYYLINVKTGEKEIVGEGLIDSFGDGYPHIHGSKILFDTYPNKSRMKELYIFDMDTNELEKIGEFFESFEFYGETRCDLHPRFNFDGTKVFFDSVHEGKRYLYMLDLESLDVG
jgi:hypothetical protein